MLWRTDCARGWRKRAALESWAAGCPPQRRPIVGPRSRNSPTAIAWEGAGQRKHLALNSSLLFSSPTHTTHTFSRTQRQRTSKPSFIPIHSLLTSSHHTPSHHLWQPLGRLHFGRDALGVRGELFSIPTWLTPPAASPHSQHRQVARREHL
jgi:hypothetical protein